MLYQSLASGSSSNEPHNQTAVPDPDAASSQACRDEEEQQPTPNIHTRASTPADALESSGALLAVLHR